MTHRQKHKGKKRPRSWHHRYNTPDRAFARAVRKLNRAMRSYNSGRASQSVDEFRVPKSEATTS